MKTSKIKVRSKLKLSLIIFIDVLLGVLCAASFITFVNAYHKLNIMLVCFSGISTLIVLLCFVCLSSIVLENIGGIEL